MFGPGGNYGFWYGDKHFSRVYSRNVILYFLGRIFFVPIKFMLKLLISSIAGGAALIAVRAVGGFFGLILPVNPVNAVITGLTGFPGIAGLLIYFNI